MPSATTTSRQDSALLSRPDRTLGMRGGTLLDYQTADILHFDPLAVSNYPVVNFAAVFCYPRLLRFRSVPYPQPADGSTEGEAAVSYEMSGDRTQLTLRLRPGMRWDARSPTNGRPIDAEDVLFSWEKYAALNASASDLAYDAGAAPGAPVDSVSAPDPGTVVMSLKQFDSSLIELLAAWDHFYVMPRESDGGFDPELEVRGHGPWRLADYVPSSSVVWSRNPDYYRGNRPFPDTLERPIVPDYDERLARFREGSIFTAVAGPQDVVPLKNDAQGSVVYQDANFDGAVSPFISFGWDGPPFTDVRMRRALSMALDRERFADAIENRDGFEDEGLDLELVRNTVVAAGRPGYWLDPTDQFAFGPSRRYLEFDLEEARSLMSAAGYEDGASFDVYYNQDTTYGAGYHRILDVYEEMLAEAGMTLQRRGSPYGFYRNEVYDFYRPARYSQRGDTGLSGIVFRATRGFATVAAGLYGMLHPQGPFYQGVAPEGGSVQNGDPDLSALIERIKREPELSQRQSLVHDAIRYITGRMYNVPRPLNTRRLSNWWPALGNAGTDNAYTAGNIWAEERLDWWVDAGQPPLASPP